MSQNQSSAVMQRRREPHDSLDDFPTPPWATRALLAHAEMEWETAAPPIGELTVREPAANRGHMAAPLTERFGRVLASDIFDYGAGFPVEDYLLGPMPDVDWTITNPPFRLAEAFIGKALVESRVGVAVFVRSAFLEGIGRYREMFSRARPALVLQFAERVVLHRGRLAPEGSTATAYCWVVWLHRGTLGKRTRFDWIPPCRKEMERPGDYPEGAP